MLPQSTLELIDSLNDHSGVVDWINQTLGAQIADETSSNPQSVDLVELDQRVTHLVATLEVACEDTSSQLERIIDDVSRGVPRLAHDLHTMRDSAVSLQNILIKIHDRSRESTPDGMVLWLDKLQTLDTAKQRMEAARDVLREAESWSTLELEVTSLLAEQSYSKAAERLSEASRSMVVFQNTPEFESRRTLMVSLQNQLEASLSSALVAAINAQDLAVCRNYFFIFSVIQRESEFRNYYNGSRRASLVALWQNANLLDCASTPSDSPPQTLSDFLPRFYTLFLALLNSERTSIIAIFPDPLFTLSSLITSVLSVLQPTFSQRLASLFNHYGTSAIKEMIACYKITEEFAAGVDKVMEKIQLAAVLPSTMEGQNSDTQKLSHRRSNRMSMSLRPGPSRSSFNGLSGSKSLSSGLDWDQELFQPFVDFQVDYGSLERRLLDDALMEIVSSDKTSESDRGRQLRERSVDVFNVAEESMWRCVSFTHGYGSVGLVQALDNLFRSFVDIWTAEITHTRRSTSFSKHGPPASSGGELEDLDYTDEDWADFQLALHLLASARAVYERMNTIEAKLKGSLLQVAMKMKSDQSNAPNTCRTSLLAQSTLNSAELHNLLNTVGSDHSTQSRDVVQALPRRGHPLGNLGSAPALLVDARTAVFDFSKACQTTLQTTILSPLRKHLASYASSPQWTVPGDPKATRIVNDLQVPSFSLSPSDTVQRVAEGLLNLPRLFEVYADDDALAFSLHSLPYVDVEIFKGLAESSEGSTVHTHVRRTSLSAKPTTLSPEAVSSAWLSSLGHSILSHLTTNILPDIPTLTNFGAAQLSSDLGYLSNIVRALNVQFEELERWKEYVSLDEEEGKEKVGGKEGDLVFRMVARMRGWAM